MAPIPPLPPLPREHGAWVMLTVPLVFGLAIAGPFSAAAWLVVPAALLVFLAHYALVPVAQRAREGRPAPPDWLRRRRVWGPAFLVGATACFAAAVVLAPAGSRATLAAFAVPAGVAGGIYAGAATLGAGRTIPGELVGMAGMALSAPMMAAAAGAGFERRWLGASAIALGYFLSSLSFVRAYDRFKTVRRAAVVTCASIHVALAAALAALATAGWLPRFWWIAFVPVVARTTWGLARPPANLRKLGLRELWVASSFTAIGAFVLVW